MSVDQDKEPGLSMPGNDAQYRVFESLPYPVLIVSTGGAPIYGNAAYLRFFQSGDSETRLDWQHPFFPEYRKRIAQSYLNALKGTETQCFAVINTPDGSQLPVEIYLFPMMHDGVVTSIMALMRIVDQRLLSFDRSTLSLITEDSAQYDRLHLEYSPVPILRVNEELEIIQCSHSLEGFLGYASEELLNQKLINGNSFFLYDADRVRNAILDIIGGKIAFHRIGEVKIRSRSDEIKVANLIFYPIVQQHTITAAEIVMEDITRIRELKDTVNAMNRIQLFSDITKGFLHTLNNTINVIMSRTQLLLQITEKDSVIDGIQVIEKSAQEMADQIKRIQNFVARGTAPKEDLTEPLVTIIEDAIEFAKMQFKVDDKENRKTIQIDKKYFSAASITTNTALLREIIISIILKVASLIERRGTVDISLKQNNNLGLVVRIRKDSRAAIPPVLPPFINIFSGIDIRQAADSIGIKVIEEESAETYAIKAIFPQRQIIDTQNREADDTRFRIRDMDIMIVEDEMALQKILFELFDRMGNRVVVCENGRDALEEFRRKRYDIVITDYGLAGITGFELAARIKELEEKTIVVLLSGWNLEDDIRGYRNVIDLYLPKPFKLDVLLKKTAKTIADKGREPK